MDKGFEGMNPISSGSISPASVTSSVNSHSDVPLYGVSSQVRIVRNIDPDSVGFYIEGTFTPSALLDDYRTKLSRLASSFEAEKKKLRDEYKRRWG